MTRKWLVYPLLAFAVAAFGAAGLAKETLVESQWTSAPVKIDGLDQDWQDATLLTDGGSNAQFSVKNDGKNLYVLFLFKDPMSASTIEYTGMKIFFNADGRKSKDLGIHFSKKQVTSDDLISSLEKKGEVLTEERKAEIRKQKAYYLFEAEVINAKKVAAPSDPATQTEPPAFATRSQRRVSVYEFRVPLSRINQPGGVGVEPGKTIKLGFEWGGMTSQIMKDMMARMVAGAGTSNHDLRIGDSVSPEMGSTGNMRSGGDYQRDPRTKFHSFWVDVKLAAQGS
jgi:hypothetical protein